MDARQFQQLYSDKKESFHHFVNKIKSSMIVDVFTIINPTLIINPYNTDFPKAFFLGKSNKKAFFFKTILKFYVKHFYVFITYLISFLLFKLYYKKTKLPSKKLIAIDVFLLATSINRENGFKENYFNGLYDVLDKYNKDYVFLPRLYGVNKNPFKLIKLFQIINNDRRNFLFEFELLSFKDFMSIFFMIAQYPFKTLRLKQQESSIDNILFNNELINDIENLGSEVFTRYIYGKNIAKLNTVSTIYSWSEFQVIERSFNYAIRKNSSPIKLIACQFYLNYETYFNTYVDDLDNEMLSSPHEVLVNGEYYLLNRNQVRYKNGVSLRYKDVFSFSKHTNGDNILLLGSYIESDTMNMLNSLGSFDRVLFKNHPAVDIRKFGKLNTNILPVNDNLYSLFKNAGMVIGTASGSSLEAVACGISVIIIASQDNFTANPLVDYGKGKIWDIAFSSDDVKKMYNKLITYRNNHADEIKKIAAWYKENFFIEPTEENIIKAFELDKE